MFLPLRASDPEVTPLLGPMLDPLNGASFGPGNRVHVFARCARGGLCAPSLLPVTPARRDGSRHSDALSAIRCASATRLISDPAGPMSDSPRGAPAREATGIETCGRPDRTDGQSRFRALLR